MCLQVTLTEPHKASEADHVKGCSEVQEATVPTSTRAEQPSRTGNMCTNLETSVYQPSAAGEWIHVHTAISKSRASADCKEIIRAFNHQAALVKNLLQYEHVLGREQILLHVRQNIRIVEHAVLRRIEQKELELSKNISEVEHIRRLADTVLPKDSSLFCEVDDVLANLALSKLDVKTLVACRIEMLHKESRLSDQILNYPPAQFCPAGVLTHSVPSLVYSLHFLAQMMMECYMASIALKHANRVAIASIQRQVGSSLQNENVRMVLGQNAQILELIRRGSGTRSEKAKQLQCKRDKPLAQLAAIEEGRSNPQRQQVCRYARAKSVRRSAHWKQSKRK